MKISRECSVSRHGGHDRTLATRDSVHAIIDGESNVADRHPKKEIQSAIEYALQRGWRFTKGGPHAHIYGKPYCPKTARDGCRINVYSTPRSPTNHANHIRRRIDRCPHAAI
jgi:hypothetical protein